MKTQILFDESAPMPDPEKMEAVLQQIRSAGKGNKTISRTAAAIVSAGEALGKTTEEAARLIQSGMNAAAVKVPGLIIPASAVGAKSGVTIRLADIFPRCDQCGNWLVLYTQRAKCRQCNGYVCARSIDCGRRHLGKHMKEAVAGRLLASARAVAERAG